MKVSITHVNDDSPAPLSISDFESRLYLGIGALNVQTPRGEVKACSGDLIVQLPGGTYVFDPVTATALFGSSAESILSTRSKLSIKESLALASDTVRVETPDFDVPVVDSSEELKDDTSKLEEEISASPILSNAPDASSSTSLPTAESTGSDGEKPKIELLPAGM